MPSSLNIEKLGPLKRRITLDLNLAMVQQLVSEKLKQRSRTARVKGFRPGKAPLNVVAEMYGDEAQSEAIQRVLLNQYQGFIRDNSIKVAGYPSFAQVEDKERTAFHATFEELPQIDLAPLQGLALKRVTVDLQESDVDEALFEIRKRRAHYHPRGQVHEHGGSADGDTAVQSGDQVVIDFVGTENGVAFERGSAEDFAFIVGAGQMLPEFEAAVLGMRPGDKKSFDMTFPGNYSAPMAGKTAQFEITLKTVAQPHIPELDADFARSLGLQDGNIEQLRADVKSNLEAQVKQELGRKNRVAVFDALLTALTFEVPQQLLQRDAERLMEQTQERMKREQGGQPAAAMPTLTVEMFQDTALRRVRLGLIVAQIVEEQSLQATANEVQEMIDSRARQYREPRQVVQWYQANPSRVEELEETIIENKVVAWLFENSKTDTTLVSLKELMGATST